MIAALENVGPRIVEWEWPGAENELPQLYWIPDGNKFISDLQKMDIHKVEAAMVADLETIDSGVLSILEELRDMRLDTYVSTNGGLLLRTWNMPATAKGGNPYQLQVGKTELVPVATVAHVTPFALADILEEQLRCTGWAIPWIKWEHEDKFDARDQVFMNPEEAAQGEKRRAAKARRAKKDAEEWKQRPSLVCIPDAGGVRKLRKENGDLSPEADAFAVSCLDTIWSTTEFSEDCPTNELFEDIYAGVKECLASLDALASGSRSKDRCDNLLWIILHKEDVDPLVPTEKRYEDDAPSNEEE
jgi:hypothetical protein